jgi:cold shock CspA family protein
MFHLFDDPALSDHLKSLQSSPAPRRKQSPKVIKHIMYTGKVSSWNSAKGFGFILQESNIPDCPTLGIFVHVRNIPEGVTIERGARVQFTTQPSKIAGKQHEAKIVRVIDEAAQ